MDNYWIFSDGQYTGEYCSGCATAAWKQYAAKLIASNDGDANYMSQELAERLPESHHETPHRGATCDGCGDTIAEPYFNCNGCGHWGYSADFNVVPDDQINWDGDGPETDWCNGCEEDNRPRPGVELLADDGRGYRLTYDPTDERYRAGCRVFTYLQAMDHWLNPNHYAPEPALRLARAVWAHHSGGTPWWARI